MRGFARARAKLPPEDIHLRVHLGRRRPRLQLSHPGELPYGGEVAPSGALQDPRHLESVGWGYTAALWCPLVKLRGDEALENLHKQPPRHHALGQENLEGRSILPGYLLSHESEPRLQRLLHERLASGDGLCEHRLRSLGDV